MPIHEFPTVVPTVLPPALAHHLDEAAARIGVGRTKLYELIDRGELRTVSIGRRQLITEAELVRFVESLEAAS